MRQGICILEAICLTPQFIPWSQIPVPSSDRIPLFSRCLSEVADSRLVRGGVETAHVLKLWFNVVLVGLALVLRGAAAEAVRVVAATPDVAFNRLFERTNGWVGADAVYSIAVGPERTLWFFGDTFVGRVAGGQRTNVTMINNSVGVQTGHGDGAGVEFCDRTRAAPRRGSDVAAPTSSDPRRRGPVLANAFDGLIRAARSQLATVDELATRTLALWSECGGVALTLSPTRLLIDGKAIPLPPGQKVWLLPAFMAGVRQIKPVNPTMADLVRAGRAAGRGRGDGSVDVRLPRLGVVRRCRGLPDRSPVGLRRAGRGLRDPR